jgi:rhodanese-related sulfurtransferase
MFSRFFGAPVPTVSALELYKKLKGREQPYVLDVRQPEEFRLGHITGAKLIPLAELGIRLNEIPKGIEIVCICASGHRSVPAVRKLTAAGYTARSMKNGMISWKMVNLPIQKGI